MNTTDLAFTSIQVQDLENSRNFYTNILDFQINNHINEPEAVVFSNHSGSIFAIRSLINESITNPGQGISLWFAIDAIDDLIIRAEREGIAISDRVPTPFGDKITLIDPDGYELTFFEQKGE